jgi:hypothetical protein
MAMIQRYRVHTWQEEIPHSLAKFGSWEFSSGPTTGEDFKVFARLFKKALVRCLPRGARLINFRAGHYDLSGFVERNGKYAYVSISDVRHFPNGWRDNILVRRAKSEHDYTGGSNGYTTLAELGKALYSLVGGEIQGELRLERR